MLLKIYIYVVRVFVYGIINLLHSPVCSFALDLEVVGAFSGDFLIIF